MAIRLQVEKVVLHIHRRRAQAKSEKREQRRRDACGVRHLMRQQEGDEDQHVFGPLVEAHGAKRLPGAGVVLEGAFDVDELFGEPVPASYENGPARVTPHLKVHRGVADIDETLRTARPLERPQLPRARTVDLTVACDDRAKDA